jgi:NAD(P)-dependent dehydrogenase (short-subunit alcohol dehydrogenase family)
MDLAGKRCFVTGAASGIGRAAAIAAAAKGADVYLTDINGEGLDSAAEEIRSAGGTVSFAAPADVSDHEAVVSLAGRIHEAYGSMDVVMNVAGISTWGAVEELSHEDWRAQVDVNLMGPIHVIEAFIPPMIEAGRGGHLVNVSSSAGLFGLPWHAAYSAAKFGLRGVSEVLRYDLKRHGIGVSLVCPGAVDTGLVGTVNIVGVDREDPAIQKLTDRFQRRAISPDDAARQIVRAVEKNRYLVLTSRDIKVGHFFQRKFELPYRVVMQKMNDKLVDFANSRKAKAAERAGSGAD